MLRRAGSSRCALLWGVGIPREHLLRPCAGPCCAAALCCSTAADVPRPAAPRSLDTGRLNPETYRLFDKVEKHYNIRIEYTFPEAEVGWRLLSPFLPAALATSGQYNPQVK